MGQKYTLQAKHNRVQGRSIHNNNTQKLLNHLSTNIKILREILTENDTEFAPVRWQEYVDACVEEISGMRGVPDAEKERLYSLLQDDLRIFRPAVMSDDGEAYDVLPTKLERAGYGVHYSFLLPYLKPNVSFYTDYRGVCMYQPEIGSTRNAQLLPIDKAVNTLAWLLRWYPMIDAQVALKMVCPLTLILCNRLSSSRKILRFQQKSLMESLSEIAKEPVSIECDSANQRVHCLVFRAFLIAFLVAICDAMETISNDTNDLFTFIRNVRSGVYNDTDVPGRLQYLLNQLTHCEIITNNLHNPGAQVFKDVFSDFVRNAFIK